MRSIFSNYLYFWSSVSNLVGYNTTQWIRSCQKKKKGKNIVILWGQSDTYFYKPSLNNLISGN